MADDFEDYDSVGAFLSRWDHHNKKPETTAQYPPRVRKLGPPEGQDYDTLSRLHGRPHGAFEQTREHIYKATTESA